MKNQEKNVWEINKFQHNHFRLYEDIIATETPFTIYIQGKEFATIVCTPSYIEELTIGFLASEGMILQYKEIKSIQIDDKKGYVYVQLTVDKPIVELDHSKRFVGSCCGKSRQFYFKSDVRTAKTIYSSIVITAQQCIERMNDMQNQATLFQETGGVHNAALAYPQEIITVREDIGRHNALDKISGYMLQNKMRANDKILIFSGRISSEALLKVSKMGIAIVISNAAPTNLALQLANDLQITVVGFLRNQTMNVYTHAERIIDENNE